jgi:hypothetical protein
MAILSPGYIHLAHVGVGWAMARLPIARRALLAPLEHELAPLAYDGWGFHDGYFRPGLIAAGRRRVRGRFANAYDQGVGRSLWFSQGAEPAALAEAVAKLSPARRDDLWSGIGLAATYAGGAEPDQLRKLALESGSSLAWMRQGAAFAVAAHDRAGLVPVHTVQAAEEICGLPAAKLSQLVDEERRIGSRPEPQPAAYEAWRGRVAMRIVRENRL